MKEQIKAPNIKLNNEEITDLSDAQFKTLVIRMLTELSELNHKMKGEIKASQSEEKLNIHDTKSERKETRTQINDLEQKEETFNQNRMKKQEFKIMRRGLGTLGQL